MIAILSLILSSIALIINIRMGITRWKKFKNKMRN